MTRALVRMRLEREFNYLVCLTIRYELDSSIQGA